MKEKFLIKAVYIPIIGLVYAGILSLTNSKNYTKVLQEKYAVIWMMISHVFVLEIICMILFWIILKP